MSKFRTLILVLVSLVLVLPAGVSAGASSARQHSKLLSVLEKGHTVDATVVSHGVAYVGGLDRLAIYDVSKPAKPRLLDWATGWVQGVAKQGRTLFVELGEGYFAVLDVSDPRNLSIITWIEAPPVESAPPSEFPLQLSFEGPVAVRKGLLYAPCADYRSPFEIYRALCIVDVSDPSSPVPVGQAPLRANTTAHHLLLRGKFAYVGEMNWLETVKVANPHRATVTRRFSNPTEGLAVDGRRLYAGVGSNDGRIKVFSLAHPGRPKRLGTLWARSYLWEADDLSITHRHGRSYLVAAWNTSPESFVYVDIYDVTSPLHRLGKKSLLLIKGSVKGIPNSSINDVQISGNKVYVSQWYKGVRISRVNFARSGR